MQIHNHRLLLSACYPASKLINGPTVPPPDSNSLSKLIFYTTQRPNKLAKVGKALVEKNGKAVYRAKRNEVAVTLDICRGLVREVRVGLVYWETEVLEIVDTVMKSAFSKDDEIVARAANLVRFA
ncbi:hypothetical protein BT69DRAFT_585974 [Atractiella rhizophila]|nr:hypothetical protein BT69DRAFT_585974 [Atractiella rhizophila]